MAEQCHTVVLGTVPTSQHGQALAISTMARCGRGLLQRDLVLDEKGERKGSGTIYLSGFLKGILATVLCLVFGSGLQWIASDRRQHKPGRLVLMAKVHNATRVAQLSLSALVVTCICRFRMLKPVVHADVHGKQLCVRNFYCLLDRKQFFSENERQFEGGIVAHGTYTHPTTSPVLRHTGFCTASIVCKICLTRHIMKIYASNHITFSAKSNCLLPASFLQQPFEFNSQHKLLNWRKEWNWGPLRLMDELYVPTV